MTKRNPIECDEFYRLRDESLRLYAEWDTIRGEVNQTPKTAPDYGDKVRQLKQTEGKWHHASQDLNQHLRDGIATHGEVWSPLEDDAWTPRPPPRWSLT